MSKIAEEQQTTRLPELFYSFGKMLSFYEPSSQVKYRVFRRNRDALELQRDWQRVGHYVRRGIYKIEKEIRK